MSSKNMQSRDSPVFTPMVGQLTSMSFEDLQKFQININFSEYSEKRVKSVKLSSIQKYFGRLVGDQGFA